MDKKIPFVISEAYPDSKSPCVNQQFGTCYESDIPSYFINRVAEFIFERNENDAINTVEGIRFFWEQYYDEHYIGNPPWEATIFIDNQWVNITPTNEEILKRIKQLIIMESQYNEHDCDRQNETSVDEKIMEKMKEYLIKENLIKDETVSNENYIGYFVKILNEYMLNENIEKFNENRELLSTFMQLLIKTIKKDIENITSNLEIIYSQENTDMLQNLQDIYGNLLEYKNYFEI